MIQFLINFLRITRPLSNIKNIAIITIAFYFSNTKFYFLPILLGFLSLSFISSAIYGYNAINDLHLDQNNENKKQYAEGVQFFGKRKSFVIILFLIIIGLTIGTFLGFYFFISLILLLLVSFFYSSKYTRFKEKIILDVLFGASLTFLLRFIAAWFVFDNSSPPLLPILALVFGKMGGYLLYKSLDREYLFKKRINNTITFLTLRSIFIFSFFFIMLMILSIVLMFLNSVYFHIDIFGSLPIRTLFLTPFIIPPIIIIFLQINKKIKFKNHFLRFCGYIYMLLTTIIIYWILL